ncbi:MAG: iron-sulfur cluster assembly accessory protein [Candidatus Spechtbacterales bacterium]
MNLHINSNATLKATKTAQEKILESAKAEKENKDLEKLPLVRVSVKPGGCSGFLYEMFFEKEAEAEDEIIQLGDVSVVIDPQSAEKIKGTTLNYVETLEMSGFKFNNPNASRTCGCGSSFG